MTDAIKKTFNINDILTILPHRYPFLLIDKILDIDTEKGTIVAQKNVTINEAFFNGHFPGAPIMPGVLIVEAMAQAGGVLVNSRGEHSDDNYALLLNIKEAKFRHPVKPGDILIIKCEGIHFSSKGGRVHATAYVGEKVAVEGEMGFALVKKEQV
jgi:3-hydroxyacyl-[acyl-carrier-protein] dehydratase